MYLFKTGQWVHKKNIGKIWNMAITTQDSKKYQNTIFRNMLKREYKQFTTKSDDVETLLSKVLYGQLDQKKMLKKLFKEAEDMKAQLTHVSQEIKSIRSIKGISSKN